MESENIWMNNIPNLKPQNPHTNDPANSKVFFFNFLFRLNKKSLANQFLCMVDYRLATYAFIDYDN